MVSSIRYKGLRFLTLFAFVVAACAVAIGENGDEDLAEAVAESGSEDSVKAVVESSNEGSEKEEVPFEQRMLRRISVEFSETPIDDVIAMMAEKANVDIIKSPKVVGTVTAKLTNVPLEEALNSILAIHGYSYVASRNMIRIAPAGEIIEKAERLVSKIYRITYADATEVTAALKNFVSKRGELTLNKGTSHIIVTDTESKIEAIDAFIDEIDHVTPQVLVEVRIYDITTQDTFDLGIEWEAGRNTDYGSGGVTDMGTNPATGSRRSPFLTGLFSNPTNKTASSSAGALRLGWLNAGIDIDMVLKAQQEVLDSKLLANPRILVLDNETAIFDIVTEHPYLEVSSTSAGGSMTSIEFKEVGTKLEVTPHVTREGMLRLQIMPEFGVKTGDASVGGSTVPVVDTRKVKTIALVKDGQTVVLGGLRRKRVTQQTNKVPLLGDLPLIGGLFRFEGEDTAVLELVVFITPRIVEQPVMSETENQLYEATDFRAREPSLTRAEKSEK